MKSKKSKKPASETLVKSLLEDLQQDESSLSESGSAMINSADAPSVLGKSLFGESSADTRATQARELPEGLENPDDVFAPAVSPNKAVAVVDDASKTVPVPADASEYSATRRIGEESSSDSITFKSQSFTDRTQPMVRPGTQPAGEASTKVSHGFQRPLTKASTGLTGGVTETQMMQAENLRLAQARILELEKECERLRQENELLSSAGDIVKRRADELFEKVQEIERRKVESLDQAQMEMNIYRENLTEKDKQLARMRQKIEDLETRLAKDLKKIRVRERELENRLELSKMEKTALVRAKDEALLDLKGKLDQLHQELESYKQRCSELNQKVDGQHEQLGRTVRALRLALTHLEANESNAVVTPLKKAE